MQCYDNQSLKQSISVVTRFKKGRERKPNSDGGLGLNSARLAELVNVASGIKSWN